MSCGVINYFIPSCYKSYFFYSTIIFFFFSHKMVHIHAIQPFKEHFAEQYLYLLVYEWSFKLQRYVKYTVYSFYKHMVYPVQFVTQDMYHVFDFLSFDASGYPGYLKTYLRNYT